MRIKTSLVYLLLATTASGALAAPVPDRALEALLEAEFALQAGDVQPAARAYLRAARAGEDVAVAERAAQVALLAGDQAVAGQALQRWRQLDPEADGLLAAEARLALARGEVPAAVGHLRQLLADAERWRGAIQALAASGKSETTIQALKALVQSDVLPANLDAWMALGGLALRLDQRGLGPQLAGRAVQQFPGQPRAWLWQAEEAQRRGDAAAARAAIDKAIATGELDSANRMAVAAQLDAIGDPAAAAAVLAEGEQDDTLLAGRAAYLARAEDDPALDELYSQAAEGADQASPGRLFLLGQLAELREKNDEALQWYGRIASGLQRDQAQLRIAVLLDKTGRLDDALARLRELQAGDSDYGEVVRDAYLLEAELLSRRGRGEDAVAAYGRGLQIFEDDPELLYARALGYERLDRIGEAEADLRRLVEQDPENADALNALGYTLADRTERYEEALALIERALELKPDTPAIIDSMGWVLFKLGRAQEAVPHLRRAFELQRDAEVAAHLGEALWVAGEKEEARRIWNAGREIDPDNRALKQVLERLDP